MTQLFLNHFLRMAIYREPSEFVQDIMKTNGGKQYVEINLANLQSRPQKGGGSIKRTIHKQNV